jgi:hypothetical protein
VILRLVYQKAVVSRILKLFRQAGKNSAAVFASRATYLGILKPF